MKSAADARSHTYTGLSEGTYQVRVRAQTDRGDGDPSTHILGATSPMRTVVVSTGNVNPP